MKISNPFFNIPIRIAVLLVPSIVGAQVLVDDSWADGDRTKTETDGELDADWWSSNASGGNSVEVSTGELGLVTGTSGRGLHATFAPQTLTVGDAITVTFTFTTPATVGTDRSTAFKISLMEFNDPGLAADLLSNSSNPQPLYFNLPGYMVDYDVNKDDTSENVTVRKHTVPNTTGRFMGTTSEWESLGGSPDDGDGYSILPATEYVGVISVTMTGAETMEIFSSLSQDGTLLDSHTQLDETGVVNNIGMLGFWANSNTFGSNSGEDPDNGINFSNVTIKRTPVPPLPRVVISSIDYDAGSIMIEWAAQIGDTYLVFASEDLVAWEEIADQTAESETEIFTEEEVPAGPRFYRIETFVEE